MQALPSGGAWTKIAWLGTACVLGGRGLLASGYYVEGFALSVVGDILWMAWGIKLRVPALYLLDGVLLVLDISGAYLHVA